MNKMKISYLILVVEILVWNSFALEIIDLTNNDNLKDDLDDKPTHNTNNNNYDLTDLLSNVLLDYSSTRTPKPTIDYQYQDVFEIPIKTNNENNYDYEFVINHHVDTTRPTLHEKKLIYIPVDYSIEFRNDKFEYSTRKSATTLARLLSSSFLNSTRLNSTNEIHLNRSNLTHLNSTHLNSTRIQLTTMKYVTLNVTNSTNSTNSTSTTTATTQKKDSFEKTYLKLESSFDEMYDIDSIPRKHGMRHLIEKRIHNHDDKMSDNTKGR